MTTACFPVVFLEGINELFVFVMEFRSIPIDAQ